MAHPVDITIIGAGITGLGIAWQLKKERPDLSIRVLEKNTEPGGLLRSFCLHGHWVDYGTFFFNDEFYPNLISTFPALFKAVDSYKHRVWYGSNQCGSYPIDLRVVFSRFSAVDWIRFFIKFPILFILKYSNVREAAGNAEEWLVQRITREFYRHSGLRIYIKKLEGLEPSQISTLFGRERLFRVDEYLKPVEMLKFIAKRIFHYQTKGKYDTLKVMYPPSGGVSVVCRKLADDCAQAGVEIFYNHPVEKLSHENGRFIINTENNTPFISRYIVSTVSINEVIRLIEPPIPAETAPKLFYENLLLTYFIVKRPTVLGDIPVYYSYDTAHRWKRLVSFTSILSSTSLEGESAVCVETTFRKGEETADLNTIEAEIKDNLINSLHLFKEHEIKTVQSRIMENAYPVFTLGYEKELQKAMDLFASWPGFWSAGRLGTFNQDNTSDCLRKSIDLARTIISRIG